MPRCGLCLALFTALAACKPAGTKTAPELTRPDAVSDLRANPETVQPLKDGHAPAPDHADVPAPTHIPWRLDMSSFSPPNIPDALWFHGWDPTGRVFVWERRQLSAGADCDLRHVLYAVDASTDRFVQDGLLTVAHDSPEANSQGLCEPEDLSSQVDEQRAAFLKRHQIVAGSLPLRVKVKKGGFEVADPRGALAFEFAVLKRSTDPFGPEVDKGAAYRLVLRGGKKGSSIVIEDGKRRRPNVMDYRLGEARWFPAPQGDYGALILQRIERGFEGPHLTWMSNGVRVRRRP